MTAKKYVTWSLQYVISSLLLYYGAIVGHVAWVERMSTFWFFIFPSFVGVTYWIMTVIWITLRDDPATQKVLRESSVAPGWFKKFDVFCDLAMTMALAGFVSYFMAIVWLFMTVSGWICSVTRTNEREKLNARETEGETSA